MNADLDRYYARNTLGITCVEFFWGLGLPVVLESTFLQLFLKHLGASSLQIGMIPLFFFVGNSIFSLLSSYYTSNLVFKRAAVILLHVLCGLSLMLFGAVLLLLGRNPSVLTAFFLCYAVFAVCVGMTVPVWLNFLVTIFTEHRSLSGLGTMLVAQNIAKLIGGLIIVRLVNSYAFSTLSSSLIFIGVGFLFAASSFFYLLTREPEGGNREAPKKRPPLHRYLVLAVRRIWNNRRFLTFLAADIDFFAVVTVISFYANYATTYHGVAPAAAAGFFVACVYLGAITANTLLGSLNLFGLRSKYALGKTCSFSALLLLVAGGAAWCFFAASFLLGVARGTRMTVYAPAVKKLSGLADTTSYYAVAPLFTLPFAACFPILCGRFLDHFHAWGPDSYRTVFAIAAAIVAFTGILLFKVDFTGAATAPARR